ncbi:dihydrolipoyllysine-residue acetyltransferase component 2 of pyruvate dehydrogenase complex, mitochondrial [Daucus carota subsp. sativus]|uniref:dihydrolipoyllysine-residue acetyltransferase component 2 of pyruvate dehydrogenase complex, mitochondrial n=1 Tax=Daucus carota subsp. sativus TaxID=79200 RepID=UPI0007EF1F02|nr:PREDICTED: dihydrolipoyllysine-residue acetyltransferase component 2 of pyruvate dehydrogenase complex, mitochondrial-like isoform X1 [Daucus carota subsp. sativus]
MSYASHIFRHSKQIKSVPGLLRYDHTLLVRWLSSAALPFTNSREYIVKLGQLGCVPLERDRARSSCTSTLNCYNHSKSAINQSMVTFVGIKHIKSTGTNLKLGSQLVGPVLSRGLSRSPGQNRRSFSSGSGLPPHQEIGMPSLSPTMTEGNIARWLKKEGDQVSTGDVLCEVETDKATVEMECMEDGYLAKIVHGDGAKEIKVGEVIAITVEDEGDIAKFNDYKPSDAAPAPKDSSASADSAPPKAKSSSFPPHQDIGMPSLSPTMTEGNIARWLKKEGDQVSTGEVLCEVETDKATVEMECMEEGYLAKIIHGEGAKGIKVGEVIAVTVEDEGDISKFKDYRPSDAAGPPKDSSVSAPPKEDVVEKPKSSPKPESSKPSEARENGGRIFASPLARKLAEENNVSLSSIKGTGPDGNIVKADIEDYMSSRGKEVSPASSKVDKTEVSALDYADIPLSQIRKVTASRLLLSKQTIPHYYLTVDTCVDKLMELREQLNSLQEASGGKRISVNDLVIKAAALALRKVPQCNSSWTNDYIRQYHNVNINVAVQTDNGLFVPVIRDADKKGLSKISEEVKVLAQKAKENNLKPEDYEGGTFTVSNLGGPFGVEQFCAIINPPQAGILAVGSAKKRVVPGAGMDDYVFASFMAVTLSCDHRVIDGAIGAEWLKAFKGFIENPDTMLL